MVVIQKKDAVFGGLGALLGGAVLAVYLSLAGASGGAVLSFPTIVDSGSQQNSFQMPAAADDCVTANWPALPAGVLGIMFVERPNVVTVRLFNFSGAPVTPQPMLYRARTNACAK